MLELMTIVLEAADVECDDVEEDTDDDGDLALVASAGESATGEATGAGAGAGVGGISVPKIATGRSTFPISYTATGEVEITLLLTLVLDQPELMWIVPDASVKFKVYCPPANVLTGLCWLRVVNSERE